MQRGSCDWEAQFLTRGFGEIKLGRDWQNK